MIVARGVLEIECFERFYPPEPRNEVGDGLFVGGEPRELEPVARQLQLREPELRRRSGGKSPERPDQSTA